MPLYIRGIDWNWAFALREDGATAVISVARMPNTRQVSRWRLFGTMVTRQVGFLCFGLPPSEVAVHPSDENDHHEFYLMCDDIQGFTRSLREKKVECSPIHEERWGLLTQVSLPGGGKLGVYQPKHPRPSGTTGSRATRKRVLTRKARTTKGTPRARRKSS